MSDTKRWVVVDDEKTHPWRWSCPNGHVGWEFTGSHLWCQQCHRQGRDPDHYEIADRKTGERVACDRVVVKEQNTLPNGRRYVRTIPRGASIDC